MNSENDGTADWPTHGQMVGLVFEEVIELIIYFMLLLILFYMWYAFLYKMDMYKSVHLVIFYGLASLVIIFRIMYFMISIFYVTSDKTLSYQWQYNMNLSDSICLYAKILLGIGQMDKFVAISAEIHVLRSSGWGRESE